jgi:hypothetical protein
MPEVEPIVARAVFPLVQIPPLSALVRVVVAPIHTPVVPDIGASAFTVTVFIAKQPVGNVYDIATIPVLIPVTTPDVEPTVAKAASLLLHKPAPLLVRVIVCPWQTLDRPLMAAMVLTVSGAVVRQEPNVKEIVVLPDVLPVAIPVAEPMLAISELVLVHTPPDTALLNVVV